MISKEEFLSQASAAYDEWIAQHPEKKNAYGPGTLRPRATL
jgi:hypothetical protein